ncbi:hypothetical protein MSG28_003578 [Choristoneura fumiferana]|uniref:Uncharacterized protein n=1 Tax=Choristoneura fumiferana TaxID=7141 RepID=A0ACC0KFI0_CHOFU|nr:hypothetical protein MSG28_003578 [Choristoneura fumiferana]
MDVCPYLEVRRAKRGVVSFNCDHDARAERAKRACRGSARRSARTDLAAFHDMPRNFMICLNWPNHEMAALQDMPRNFMICLNVTRQIVKRAVARSVRVAAAAESRAPEKKGYETARNMSSLTRFKTNFAFECVEPLVRKLTLNEVRGSVTVQVATSMDVFVMDGEVLRPLTSDLVVQIIGDGNLSDFDESDLKDQFLQYNKEGGGSTSSDEDVQNQYVDDLILCWRGIDTFEELGESAAMRGQVESGTIK